MGKFGGGGRFFFFFYDITKIRSFNYINVYLKQLKNYLFICDKEEKIPNFCIIGNKYDLENEKKIGNDITVDTCMYLITATRLPLNSRGSARPTDKVL